MTLSMEHLVTVTGKSFSEALILASTNPQYDNRLFIDLPVRWACGFQNLVWTSV